jgi:hypothetical protein
LKCNNNILTFYKFFYSQLFCDGTTFHVVQSISWMYCHHSCKILVRVARSLVFCVMFNISFFGLFSPFSSGHCVICLFSNYGSDIWYLQTYLNPPMFHTFTLDGFLSLKSHILLVSYQEVWHSSVKCVNALWLYELCYTEKLVWGFRP